MANPSEIQVKVKIIGHSVARDVGGGVEQQPVQRQARQQRKKTISANWRFVARNMDICPVRTRAFDLAEDVFALSFAVVGNL